MGSPPKSIPIHRFEPRRPSNEDRSVAPQRLASVPIFPQEFHQLLISFQQTEKRYTLFALALV